MHIHRENAMSAGDGDAISNQASRDGDARLIFLIGATVGEVGNDGSNTSSGGAFECINHNEQFHNRAIDRRTERLNHKNVTATHIIIDFYEYIFIAKLKNI